MIDDNEMNERKERLLKYAEALRSTMRKLQFDLSASSAVVRDELTWLRDRVKNWSIPAQIHTKKPDATPAKERRSRPRRKGNLVSILVSIGDSEPEPLSGWVVDRNQDGIGLLLDDAIPVGTILSVRPTATSTSIATRWLQVTVRNCRKERSSWHIGCQFMQAVSWEELQTFG